jgi:hypothetical protein
MKKIIFSIIGFALFTNVVALVQGMVVNASTGSDGNTAREEAEGKIIWEKLQAKEVQCADLSDEDFEVLGEYLMG